MTEAILEALPADPDALRQHLAKDRAVRQQHAWQVFARLREGRSRRLREEADDLDELNRLLTNLGSVQQRQKKGA
jgi:hypothetical protein